MSKVARAGLNSGPGGTQVRAFKLMLGLHLSSTGPHTLHEQRSFPCYVGFSPCRPPLVAALPRKATERFSAAQLQTPVRQLDWSLAAVGTGSFRASDRCRLKSWSLLSHITKHGIAGCELNNSHGAASKLCQHIQKGPWSLALLVRMNVVA